MLGFHADNGSEYVNHQVAAMLNKLHVPNFTKSRARRSNDNALVEGKNASVVRKWFGHDHPDTYPLWWSRINTSQSSRLRRKPRVTCLRPFSTLTRLSVRPNAYAPA